MQTINVPELKRIWQQRPIYIWGAAIVGMGICRTLERLACLPKGFLDKSPRFQNRTVFDYPVFHPDHVLQDPSKKQACFIIIASGHYEDEIVSECLRHGLAPGNDFISARQLSPYDPSVDISGCCNLRCISCPNGNMVHQTPRGFMSPNTYEKVLDKLLEEIPLLGSVQLCCWGEPLLNKHIAEIVEETVRRKVLCAISSNLNIKRDFSDLIRAKPDWFRVSVSGDDVSYATTHTGGNWDLLTDNLYRLKKYKERYHPELYVEIDYHLYRHTTEASFSKIAALCQELGFALRPAWAYLYPLDNVRAFCEGQNLSQEAEKTLSLLSMGIEDGLARAKEQSHLPCPEERCLPIAWNLNVRSCGAYFLPVVATNFLKTPLNEIKARRIQSGICKECKQWGLHRFTAVYVEEPLPKH